MLLNKFYPFGKARNKRPVINANSKRYLRKPNIRSNGTSDLYIKDFLAPIVTALFVVLLQQLFLVENKMKESKIEIWKDLKRNQVPVLNRIIGLTNNYITTESKLYYSDKNVLVTITIPSFIDNPIRRKHFINDLAEIEKNRDLLDVEIYAAYERFLNFYIEIPLPDINNKEEIFNSEWKDPKTQKECWKLLDDLRTLAWEELYENQ